MRTSVDQPARLQMWIAVIAICLLAGSSLVAIARVIAMSYASASGREAHLSRQEAAPDGAVGAFATDPQSFWSEAAETSSSRRVGRLAANAESSGRSVPIERYGDVAGTERAHVKNTGSDSDRASGSAVATGGTVGSYAVTVRFRDGSTIVLSQATPRSWRMGSRVIAIAGASTSIDE